MNHRHTLDRAVLRITGRDIRLMGKWQPLDFLEPYLDELASELNLAMSSLKRCRDISDTLEVMENSSSPSEDGDRGTPQLF